MFSRTGHTGHVDLEVSAVRLDCLGYLMHRKIGQ